MRRPPRPADLKDLESFLDRPDHPDGALTLGETRGFLFAVACAPELIRPSEWIPEVFGGESPAFESAEEAERVIGALMSLYNEVTGLARASAARLPDACALHPDPLANLGSEAPIAAWSRGFREGHAWLDELWNAPLPGEVDQELGAVLTTLLFFGLGERAEFLIAEMMPSMSAPEAAALMQRVFPDAVVQYARLGRVLEEASKAPARMPGRNEPCPCGSGRKFKQCCGGAG